MVPSSSLLHGLPALVPTVVALVSGIANAQPAAPAPAGYPGRPIRVIASAVPGGGLNIVTRLVLDTTTQRTGIGFVLDPQGGGSGTIAARTVATAAPDGHTLLSSGNQFIINGGLQRMAFDIRQTFVPVARLTSAHYIIFAHTSLPANSIKELVAYARNNPGKISFGSSGNGSVPHLGMEIMKATAGMDIVHIPYKGNGPANIDLAGGRIQLLFGNISTHHVVKAGKAKVIGVVSPTRMPLFPDVATAAESGFPGLELGNIYTIYAPIRTPASIVASLNRELAQTVSMPELKEKFAADFAEASPPYTPEELRDLFLAEYDKWDSAIKVAKIKLDE